MVTPLEYLATFAIGVTGSGVVLFGSYIGLQNFEQLPKKLFSRLNSAVYLIFGGAIAFILQLAYSGSFAPLYSLAVGVGWPALIIGLSTSQNAQKITDAQMQQIQDFINKAGGS